MIDIKSTVDAIEEARRAKANQDKLTAEEIETLTKCVNNVAGSEHGLVFFKRLAKVCRIYAETPTGNGMEAICDAARKNVYLAFRQLLTAENKARVES